MRFFVFTPLRLSTNTWQPRTHAPLRVPASLGRVPAPAPFRGRRLPRRGFRLRAHVWEPSLNRPGTIPVSGIFSRGGNARAASRFHTPELAERTGRARLDARPCCPLSGFTPPRNAPVPLRSGAAITPAWRTVRGHFKPGSNADSLARRRRAPRRPGSAWTSNPCASGPRPGLIRCRWFSAPAKSVGSRRVRRSSGNRAFSALCGSAAKPSSRPRAKALGGLWTAARSPMRAIRAPSLDGAALAECTPLAGTVAAVALLKNPCFLSC